MNAESSRSHLICCLVVKLKNRRTKVESVGKLTLVDLAGSERVDKSGAQVSLSLFLRLRVFFYILVVSYFMWNGALDSSGLLLTYTLISLA